ncbi:unnamed protein product, partial [Ectocarpus fasciculatus]
PTPHSTTRGEERRKTCLLVVVSLSQTVPICASPRPACGRARDCPWVEINSSQTRGDIKGTAAAQLTREEARGPTREGSREGRGLGRDTRDRQQAARGSRGDGWQKGHGRATPG